MKIARIFPHPLLRCTPVRGKESQIASASMVNRGAPACRYFRHSTRWWAPQPADDPNFMSIVDTPPKIVRVGGRRHGPGLLILALIPLTAFGLGTWQVQRLEWKSRLIATVEEQLVREPLALPPRIDPSAIADFDYRRIYCVGHLRHDKEMLIGPRVMDGKDGYLVVTPLERAGDGTTVLVSRGWIKKELKDQKNRAAESLPTSEVRIEGLIRKPLKKNIFTPENKPETGEFYFPDVAQMASLAGSQPVWIEETMEPDLLASWARETKGIPIGRPAEVNLKNNHAQYIFTWYALAAATSVMLWMVVKKPPADVARRVRQSKDWS